MIDKEQVKHIANLARLKLNDQEVQNYTKQLSSVLDYIQKLEEVSGEEAEPMVHASPIERKYREDEVVKELSTEEKLQNAPEKTGNLVKVPPIVG